MTDTENASTERVVKLVESCEGVVLRTFYCIHDPQFEHWMSDEPFDGAIWTKDPKRRQEFSRRREAEAELMEFQDWREERAQEQELADTTPGEREAA